MACGYTTAPVELQPQTPVSATLVPSSLAGCWWLADWRAGSSSRRARWAKRPDATMGEVGAEKTQWHTVRPRSQHESLRVGCAPSCFDAPKVTTGCGQAPLAPSRCLPEHGQHARHWYCGQRRRQGGGNLVKCSHGRGHACKSVAWVRVVVAGL